MAGLLGRLLGIVKVAVISGGAWAQFEKHVLAFLPHDQRLKSLSLLPTCGAKFYRFDGAWKKLYSEDFTADEEKAIIGALGRAIDQSGFRAGQQWGDLNEDRDSQITFLPSASRLRCPTSKNGIPISPSARRSRASSVQ